MSITFCIEAHSPTEDEALRSEDAPELNVHNTGGQARPGGIGAVEEVEPGS